MDKIPFNTSQVIAYLLPGLFSLCVITFIIYDWDLDNALFYLQSLIGEVGLFVVLLAFVFCSVLLINTLENLLRIGAILKKIDKDVNYNYFYDAQEVDIAKLYRINFTYFTAYGVLIAMLLVFLIIELWFTKLPIQQELYSISVIIEIVFLITSILERRHLKRFLVYATNK